MALKLYGTKNGNSGGQPAQKLSFVKGGNPRTDVAATRGDGGKLTNFYGTAGFKKGGKK
jgi:hypothetical protein